jgi:hypothetical protein
MSRVLQDDDQQVHQFLVRVQWPLTSPMQLDLENELGGLWPHATHWSHFYYARPEEDLL